MGDVIDLRTRRARGSAPADTARSRIAAAVRAAGGREQLARHLSARLGWRIYPSTVAAWESWVTPPADVLLAAEDLAAPSGCGAISGRTLQAIRESLGLTHVDLAAAVDGEAGTVASWEDSRRDLPRASAVTLRTLQRRLRALGAGDSAVEALGAAIEADWLLEQLTRDAPRSVAQLRRHPLATSVMRRDVSDLLAWPFTDLLPTALAQAGCVAVAPGLASGEREAFFTHLQVMAEHSVRTWPDPSDPQPHRQVYYSLQWDPRPETWAWVEEMERIERRAWRPDRGWTPRWVTARSAAITQARQGDPGPLRAFIADGLDGRACCEDADLNYWANWLGETGATWCTDEAMAGGLHRWAGHLLLDRFTAQLVPDEPLLDLYAASTTALVRRRPHLLDDPRAAARLRQAAEATLGIDTLDSATRRKLEDLAATGVRN